MMRASHNGEPGPAILWPRAVGAFALCLSQAHPIPESERRWDPSLAEWRIEAAGERPLFRGHTQPHRAGREPEPHRGFRRGLVREGP